MPSHPTSWRSILILSFHLRLGLPSGLIPSTFPTKNLYTTLFYPIRATCLAHLILLDLITRTIFSEQYRSRSFSLCNFLHFPCHLVPLRPKYSHRHPISKHPYPTFLPQCERPSFTPIQNIYLSLNLLLLVLSTLTLSMFLSHFAVELMIFLP